MGQKTNTLHLGDSLLLNSVDVIRNSFEINKSKLFLIFFKIKQGLILHSRQKLSCLKSGVST